MLFPTSQLIPAMRCICVMYSTSRIHLAGALLEQMISQQYRQQQRGASGPAPIHPPAFIASDTNTADPAVVQQWSRKAYSSKSNVPGTRSPTGPTARHRGRASCFSYGSAQVTSVSQHLHCSTHPLMPTVSTKSDCLGAWYGLLNDSQW